MKQSGNTDLNLNDLKTKIDKRLNYETGTEEQKSYEADFQKFVNNQPPYEASSTDTQNIYINGLKNLEDKKYTNIKKNHTKEDNEIFLNLLLISNDEIIELLEKKELEKKELETLKKTNNKFIARNYHYFYKHIIKKEPSYIQQIIKLTNDIYELNSVKTDIEKLLPIYLQEDSVLVPGGNKKEKDRKSQKIYTIGKRYKLLSKNSYHISGTPYAETRVFDGMEDGYYVFYMPSNPKNRYKYKPGLWIIKPCSSIKTKKDKCRKFRRTKRRT